MAGKCADCRISLCGEEGHVSSVWLLPESQLEAPIALAVREKKADY